MNLHNPHSPLAGGDTSRLGVGCADRANGFDGDLRVHGGDRDSER